MTENQTEEEKAAAEKAAAEKKEQETPPTGDELTEIEQVAMKIGWKPDHDDDSFVDAETFIINSREINSNMSKKLRRVNSEMEAMRQAVDMLTEHNANAVEIEANRIKGTIEKLKVDRDAAVEDGNTAEFHRIEAEIQQLEGEAQAKKKNKPAKTAKSPEFIEWAEDNPWYEDNPEMRRWADNYFDNHMPPSIKALADTNRAKLLDHIAEQARMAYPEHFKTETKPPANDDDDTKPPKKKAGVQRVAAPSRKTNANNKKTYTFNDLSYEQKKICEDMVMRFKGTKMEMTKDEYATKVLSASEEE